MYGPTAFQSLGIITSQSNFSTTIQSCRGSERPHLRFKGWLDLFRPGRPHPSPRLINEWGRPR